MNSLDILEIMPIEFQGKKKVIHIYKKVKIKELTASRIIDLYINLGFKKLPSVFSIQNFYMIIFFPKPPILISKRDGRLYSFRGKWDLKEAQHQASLIMRVLSEFNYVEKHQRKSMRRRK